MVAATAGGSPEQRSSFFFPFSPFPSSVLTVANRNGDGGHSWRDLREDDGAAAWPLPTCAFPFVVERAAVKRPCDGASGPVSRRRAHGSAER
jgi:hypothetical protein